MLLLQQQLGNMLSLNFEEKDFVKLLQENDDFHQFWDVLQEMMKYIAHNFEDASHLNSTNLHGHYRRLC